MQEAKVWLEPVSITHVCERCREIVCLDPGTSVPLLMNMDESFHVINHGEVVMKDPHLCGRFRSIMWAGLVVLPRMTGIRKGSSELFISDSNVKPRGERVSAESRICVCACACVHVCSLIHSVLHNSSKRLEKHSADRHRDFIKVI